MSAFVMRLPPNVGYMYAMWIIRVQLKQKSLAKKMLGKKVLGEMCFEEFCNIKGHQATIIVVEHVTPKNWIAQRVAFPLIKE